MTTRTLACIGLLAALSSASAQRGGGASKAAAAKRATCRIDTTAAWFKAQRVWFDESGHTWTNDTLRAKLLQAAGLDVPLHAPVELGWQIEGRDPAVGPRDSAMIAQLKRSGRGGSPTKSTVGAAGVHASYLLALRDTSLTRSALHPLMEAGPDESPAADVATLEDRNRLMVGRKQIYGTQFRVDPAGKVVLLPMEDSAHADLRREDAMLPPFKTSACLARASQQRAP